MKVTIEKHQNKLRLRWICPETGKRIPLALGVDDSTTGRAFAATIKDRIENDAKHGYYDASLLKYRPLTIGKNASEITTVELFERFTQHQFKQEGLAKSSIESILLPLCRFCRVQIGDGREGRGIFRP
jgi:integrase